ncbi:uncharacterized protein LAESUDRAFT_663995 [Laetiporus sulphureus 93-53]|uniref:rRNA-processing protein EFG1 n=1 Tax=Laetiporus sulphureus 93-53 TaxID=1314785 RepID=A0A165BQH0_9APHY|nr:uncharacterized protein LAESUDRAFT_663995 [Laetiporus sulphureus 93-53]KZT01468.1 hypothetical protein LAESUDRAFT_663995 [Laetiporus sulphureus 93-53]
MRRGQSSAACSSASVTESSQPSGHKSKRVHHRRKHNIEPSSPLALPGVQKIKAALRQTRRLLAKDHIAADVRAKAERKLKSLEADLVEAECARKERVMASRYHAVKFFERQKLIRRIQQVKRQLHEDEEGDGAKSTKKEQKQLEKRLEELRVDLNYIIVHVLIWFHQHYPKLKKYISLFPPELRARPHAHPDPYPHLYSHLSSPGDTSAKPENDTNVQREQVRAWVREQMAAGEMTAEPELELKGREAGKSRQPIEHADHPMLPVNSNQKPAKEEALAAIGSKSVVEDAFFGDDKSSESDSTVEEEVHGGDEEAVQEDSEMDEA